MTKTTQTNGMDAIPEPIMRALKGLLVRIRCVIVIRGLCAVLAAGIGSALMVMAVDAGMVLFAGWIRWVLAGAIYVVMAIFTVVFLVRPLARSFTLTGVARMIEVRHPELQERISSAIELLTWKDDPEYRGSEALITALTDEAIRDARAIEPRHEVTLRAVVPWLAVALAFMTVLAVLLLAWPQQTALLLARAVAPFVNLPNAHAVKLRVEPGDTVLARGTRLQVSAWVTQASVSHAAFRRVLPNGKESVEMMTRLPPPDSNTICFAMTLPSVDASFRFRIHAGDALSRYYRVRVVQPPAVQRLDVHYAFPSYTRMEPRVDRNSEGSIAAVSGSRMTLSAALNKPVVTAEMWIAGSSSLIVTGQVVRAENGEITGVFEKELIPEMSGRWGLRLVDEYGFTNAPYERSIRAVPDACPKARITRLNQKELHLNRDERLPVFFAAEDDWGLQSVALMLEADGKKLAPRFLSSVTNGQPCSRLLEGQTQVVLADPELAKAQRVTFQIRALDNLPESSKGPQAGYSEIITIVLNEQAKSFDEQVLNAQEQRIRRDLQLAQKELEAAAAISRPLEQNAGKETALSDNTRRQIDQVRDHVMKSEATVRDLAEEIKGGYYDELSRKLAQIAEDPISKAEVLADQIKMAETSAEREARAKEAAIAVEASIVALADITNRLSTATAALREAVELRELAKKQAELAEIKLAMERTPAPPQPKQGETPADERPMSSNEWQKAQAHISDDLAKLAKETPGAAQALMSMDRERLAKSEADVADLAREQAELAEATQKMGESLQTREKAIRDLAQQQDSLANEVKTDPLTAAQSAPMSRASDDLKAGRLERAIKAQQFAEKGLMSAVDQIQAESEQTNLAFDVDATLTPQQRAEALAKQAEASANAADQSVKEAHGAAQEARRRAEAGQAFAQQVKPLGNEALTKLLTNQVSQAQQTAQEAERLTKEADQAAQQTREAAGQARQAADQAVKASTPQAAQDAERLAGQKARESAEKARMAAELAREVALVSSTPGSLQYQALQAAGTADQAAHRAQQAAWQADQSQQKAQEILDKARQAEQSARQSGNEAQARESAEKASQAKTAAQVSKDASQQAEDSSRAAKDTARQAQQAADRAAQATGVNETLALTKEAIQKAQETLRLAQAADQAAQKAQQAVADQTIKPQQLAQNAVKQAEQAVQHAKQSVQQAQQAASQAKQQAEQEQQWAQQARQSGLDAAARSLEAEAENNRSAAQNSQKAIARAQKEAEASDDAVKAARKAADRIRPDVPMKDRNVQKALKDAHEAMDRAEQAELAAHEARHAVGNQITPQQVAQEALNDAEQASQYARGAAQEAQQAVRQAQQSAQSAANREPLARPLADLAGQAQQEAQKTQQAAQLTDQMLQQARQAADQSSREMSPQVAQQVRQKAEDIARNTRQAVQRAEWGEAEARQAQEKGRSRQVADMAERQKQIREKADQLRSAQAVPDENRREQKLNALKKRQEKLAHEAEDLAKGVERVNPQTDRLESQVAGAERQAIDALEADKANQAAQYAETAAKNLDVLAQRLEDSALAEVGKQAEKIAEGTAKDAKPAQEEKDAGQKPVLTDLADRARTAAIRQHVLAHDITELDDTRPFVQMVQQQDQLADRVKVMAESADMLRDHAREVGLNPQSQPQSAQTADHLARAAQQSGQAARQMEQAAEQKNSGAAKAIPDQALQSIRQTQQASAESLKQAAQTLEALGKTLAQADTPTVQEQKSRELAEAYQEAGEAARTQRGVDALQAAEQLAQAANQASDKAWTLGANPNPASRRDWVADGQQSETEIQKAAESPTWVRFLGGKIKDWLRLPGELRDDILQDNAMDGPEEYRPMIKRYFEEIAREDNGE